MRAVMKQVSKNGCKAANDSCHQTGVKILMRTPVNLHIVNVMVMQCLDWLWYRHKNIGSKLKENSGDSWMMIILIPSPLVCAFGANQQVVVCIFVCCFWDQRNENSSCQKQTVLHWGMRTLATSRISFYWPGSWDICFIGYFLLMRSLWSV